MRWPIIRVIWLRELRDQLRDRRTMFLVVVLPLLIYPLAGLGIMQLAAGFLQKKVVIGIVGAEYLPDGKTAAAGQRAYPPLVQLRGDNSSFAPGLLSEQETSMVTLRIFAA